MKPQNLKPALRELAARSERIVEFALVRDANGQLAEDNSGSGFKTAAKFGLGAAGAAGAAVAGTRGYHYYNAVKSAGKGSFRKGVSNAVDYNAFRGDGAAEKIIGAAAQKSARAGWMGKLGKVGNFLTKFEAVLAGQKEFSGYDYKPAYIARRADGSIAAMGIRQAPKEGVAPFMNRNSGVLAAPVAGAGAGALAGGMLASRFMPKNKKLAIVGGLVSGAGIAAGVGRGVDKKRKSDEARRVGAIAGIAGLAHNRKIAEARNSQAMR